MAALIKINGHPLVPNPSRIERGEFDIVTGATRTADGTFVAEFVATKRKITIVYDVIADHDLAAIYALKSPGQMFFAVEFPNPGTGTATMTAYFGDRTDNAWHTIGGVRYWQDVQISLIER